MELDRGEELDAPFARIDRTGRERFDIHWMRHTGKWWRLHDGAQTPTAEGRAKSRRATRMPKP
jgi:hypothetical protein